VKYVANNKKKLKYCRFNSFILPFNNSLMSFDNILKDKLLIRIEIDATRKCLYSSMYRFVLDDKLSLKS
jgi:hypothetical protein